MKPTTIHRGAPVGNQRAVKDEPKSSFLQVRCLSSDKGGWVKAANRAARAGEIKKDGRGTLAPWVVKVLNEAAARAGFATGRNAEKLTSHSAAG